MDTSTIEFSHGILCKTYEEQANLQGFTFGEDAERVEEVGYGLKYAHIHGCITEQEFRNIILRFQKNILLKKLKPLSESEDRTE